MTGENEYDLLTKYVIKKASSFHIFYGHARDSCGITICQERQRCLPFSSNRQAPFGSSIFHLRYSYSEAMLDKMLHEESKSKSTSAKTAPRTPQLVECPKITSSDACFPTNSDLSLIEVGNYDSCTCELGDFN